MFFVDGGLDGPFGSDDMNCPTPVCSTVGFGSLRVLCRETLLIIVIFGILLFVLCVADFFQNMHVTIASCPKAGPLAHSRYDKVVCTCLTCARFHTRGGVRT